MPLRSRLCFGCVSFLIARAGGYLCLVVDALSCGGFVPWRMFQWLLPGARVLVQLDGRLIC
eukprot:scaffold50088_cov49-Cyclotella_meneghiniana.AAC.2